MPRTWLDSSGTSLRYSASVNQSISSFTLWVSSHTPTPPLPPHFSSLSASTLFHFPLPPSFLQENYNTLLIKYAEAENTIDRMRLEAKVVHLQVALSFITV